MEDYRKRALVTRPEEPSKGEKEEEVLFQGIESCKEFIKNFLAAIPIRELEADVKRGLAMSTPLHHRLQIRVSLHAIATVRRRP